ncbi:MAG: FG-GAP-like repeat-containing protein, partial [Bacteroidota bacterium]
MSFLLLCQCWIVQMVEAQNIRYIPLNGTSHITNKTIDNRLPTGAIPAEASVDENGGASYVIPIYAAPGTNVVSPKIALAYNSMMGNGVLGQGWSISGLSSITRDGKSVHFDGKRTPVDLSSFDRFLLDGMRLSLRSGTYGANGSTYRKEVDDFAIVTAHGNMNGSPQYFKVEKKDGTIMEYGNSSDSRFLNQNGNEVLIWRLNRIWYRDGNYIQFVWTSTDRDNRISEIRYTGNTITGQSPYNLIRFHYKVRRDQNAIYEAGSNLESRYLLDRIEVTAENSTVKNYELYYSFDNYRSLLNTVNEKGSDGSALNTTIFKYGNQPTDFSSESLTAFTNSSTDVFSGDFNGDGYTDILTSPYSYSVDDSIKYNTSLRVYQRTATNSNYTLTTNINLPSESTVVNGMNVPKFHNFIASDFTGDGRDDIMTMKASIYGSQNWRILEYMRLYESTGTSFSSSFVYPPAGFDRIPLNVRHFYPGDFNGDGITDYILFLSDAIGYKMFMTLGGTNVNNVEVSGLATLYLSGDWFNADDIRVIDFDGDGKMELLRVKDSKTKIYTFRENGNAISAHQLYDSGFPTKWHRLFFGDFNGDQKTDMLVRNSLNTNGGDWKTYLSTGKGFVSTPFTFTTTPDITGKENDDRLEIGDFNGDGKTDVLHSRTQNTSLRLDLYYSQGKTFRYESETYSDSLSTLPSLQCDLNGDGRTDLLAHTGASPFPVLMYFKKEGQELLLQNVVDGHLRRTNFTYRRMTQPSNFYLQSSFTSHPQNTVNMPLYLTYQLQQDNGIGGYFETRYRYEDAYVLRTGKGFLGFREFHSIDLTNDVRTEIHKNQDPTVYILAPHQVRRYVHSTGYLFNQINYSRSLIARPNKSYWLRIDGLTEHLYLQGQTKTSVYTYDNHGNIVREVANNGVET